MIYSFIKVISEWKTDLFWCLSHSSSCEVLSRQDFMTFCFWFYFFAHLFWLKIKVDKLKGHSQGGPNPHFLFAYLKVLYCANQTKKNASKNIDFWRSYGHLKMLIFDALKKSSFLENLICDVTWGTFLKIKYFWAQTEARKWL